MLSTFHKFRISAFSQPKLNILHETILYDNKCTNLSSHTFFITLCAKFKLIISAVYIEQYTNFYITRNRVHSTQMSPLTYTRHRIDFWHQSVTVTLNFGASKYLVSKFTSCQVFNNQVHSSITFTLWVILTETSGYWHLIRPNQYSPLPEWWVMKTKQTSTRLPLPQPGVRKLSLRFLVNIGMIGCKYMKTRSMKSSKVSFYLSYTDVSSDGTEMANSCLFIFCFLLHICTNKLWFISQYEI